MKGTAGLASVVVDAASMLEALLLREAVLLGEGDLLTVERQVQQVLRQVGSSVIVSGVLRQRAAGPESEATACPACGGRLHLALRERPRGAGAGGGLSVCATDLP
jgi:hypothetical protein